MEEVSVMLGPRPKAWDAAEKYKVSGKFTKARQETIEAAGPYFMGLVTRLVTLISLTDDLVLGMILEEEDDLTTNELLEGFRKDDPSEVLGIDPTAKLIDPYLILGLENYRWRATGKEIKAAYRIKAMKYHPDKYQGECRFFRCIQRAFDELTNPVSRRHWDSVDPNVDDSIPSLKEKGDFFEIYKPVFEREARFSVNKDVPSLGTMEDSTEKVREFYTFWANFNSWRTFVDPDVSKEITNCENRYEKRYVERMGNDAKSNRLKREDASRVSRLVQQALALDPRMKKAAATRRQYPKKSNVSRNPLKSPITQEEEEQLRIKKHQEEEVQMQERKANKERERVIRKNVRRLCREYKLPASSSELGEDTTVSLEDMEYLLSSSKPLPELENFFSALSLAAKSGDRKKFLNVISSNLGTRTACM